MKRKLIAFTLIAVGAAFVVVGLAQGGYESVLYKAILICLECIGIG